MKHLIMMAAFAVSLLTLLAACGVGPPAGESLDQATPSGPAATEPAISSTGGITTLLSPVEVAEVAELAGGVGLTTEYRDLMPNAANAYPAQAEHMKSFDLLNFIAVGGSRSLSLTTLGFDSAEAAAGHLEFVVGETPGMEEHSEKIGDASYYIVVNGSGIGSFVVFKLGDRVVLLHSAQPDGVEPLMGLAALETLARKVAGRL